MKKIFFLIMSIIILNTSNNAQVREIESRTFFKKGDLEFNVSTNIGTGFSKSTETYSNQRTSTYDSSYFENTYESSGRPFCLLFTASIGYCIIDGLSIESGLDINLITDAEASISLMGNLSYTFNIPRKIIYPFIKLGYGLSNYNPDHHYGYPDGPGGNSLDTKVLNMGAGLKFIYTSGMAMKIEINYKNYNSSSSYSHTDLYYQNYEKNETVVNAITLSLGFSILL